MTSFQTCTLEAQQGDHLQGDPIALSGIVPIKGHAGSTKGTPKYVTVYKTTPRTRRRSSRFYRGGTVKGWTKVGKVRTDGLGKYRKESQSSADHLLLRLVPP